MCGSRKIQIPTTEGHCKFRKGEGSYRPKFLKGGMNLNWNFKKGGGSNQKKNLVGGVWIFSGTT